jgi:hypothetical protein
VVRVSPSLELLALATVAFLAVLAVVSYYVADTAEDLAGEFTRRAGLGALGAGGVLVVVFAEGVQVLAEVPGVVIALLGLGAILGDFSAGAFGAAAIVTYGVLTAVREEP